MGLLLGWRSIVSMTIIVSYYLFHGIFILKQVKPFSVKQILNLVVTSVEKNPTDMVSIKIDYEFQWWKNGLNDVVNVFVLNDINCYF